MTGTNDLSQYPLLVREFAAYKTTIQGCSHKTVDEYLLDLRTFFRFISAKRLKMPFDNEALEKIDLTMIDAEFICSITTIEIYEFIHYTGMQRKNESCAKARKLSAIKAFYKYLVQKAHVLDVNPASDIESPKKKKTLPKYLTLEESISLLNSVKTDTASKTRDRDFAIITLFLNCGMRLSELTGISMNDIDPDLTSLRVVGKGAKERIVYLNDACREAIITYLPSRLTLLRSGSNENALFVSSRGQRISVKTVQWMVQKYLQAAGLQYKHYSTHKLRHTAATLMYQTGEVDIRVLKDILGHEQLTTTQIYTHVSNRGMEEAMSKNPLSKISPPKKE